MACIDDIGKWIMAVGMFNWNRQAHMYHIMDDNDTKRPFELQKSGKMMRLWTT